MIGVTPAFQQRFFFLAKRFIAGETVHQAMDAVAALNAQGMSATLDFLGEDVTVRAEADRTRDAYFALLDAIRTRGVETNVSVKLTAMGLLIDDDLVITCAHVVNAMCSGSPAPRRYVTWKRHCLCTRGAAGHRSRRGSR